MAWPPTTAISSSIFVTLRGAMIAMIPAPPYANRGRKSGGGEAGCVSGTGDAHVMVGLHRSRNVKQCVARQYWLRSCAVPRRFRANHVKKREVARRQTVYR